MRTRSKKPNKTQDAFNFRMPHPLRGRLDTLAARHGLKPADLVRNALWVKLPEWERDGVTMAVTAN
jgi:predicted DNA-binding protein